MGIPSNSANFLLFSKAKGASFQNTLMLGRQQLFIDTDEAISLSRKWNLKTTDFISDKYAESFFTALEANVVDSIDQSDYESASIIHDLNKPIDEYLKRKYSVVFDGGTLEHVFNFPQAIKNCMDMLKVSGHFISITPANNYCGHGFYQFSPELFFSTFTEQNGFKLKMLAIVLDTPKSQLSWYEVKNPATVKSRITLSNSNPTSMMILAEKIRETGNIELLPFQSDYENVWSVFDSIRNDTIRTSESKWIYYYRKWMPGFVKNIIRKMSNRNLDRTENIEGLGSVNPDFFKKIDF